MRAPITLAILLVTLATGDSVTDHTGPDAPPSPDAIIIVSKGRDWSVEQLHQSGLEFLRKNGSLPKESHPRPIVHILPDDKVTMCEILYVQDFGQPYWRVKIGYNGKVINYEKRVKREG